MEVRQNFGLISLVASDELSPGEGFGFLRETGLGRRGAMKLFLVSLEGELDYVYL